MHLNRLQLWQFRCFESLSLDFAPGINWIQGDNASGKTTILEAIHLVGRGKSFRTSKLGVLPQGQKSQTAIAVELNQGAQQHHLGWGRDGQQTQLKLNHALAANQHQLSLHLPLLLIAPDQSQWLMGEPALRRQLLDFSLYYTQNDFLPQWRNYRRALYQRNQALKHHWSSVDVQLWDVALAESGESIFLMRQTLAEHLAQSLTQLMPLLLPEVSQNIQWKVQSGWPKEQTLAESLAHHLEKDRQLGFTHPGIHRGDLRILLDGQDWYQVLSRGQQKIFAAAMMLAQAHWVHQGCQKSPVILVDDLTAELDPLHLSRFLTALSAYPGQSLITSIHKIDGLTPQCKHHLSH